MAFSKLVVITSLLMMLLLGQQSQGKGTSFSFDSFQNPLTSNLSLQGDAHVPLETKFLRLTKTNDSGVPGGWSTGRVLYSNSILMWDTSTKKEASFDSTIKFSIASGRINAADGLAFFIAPVGTTIPDNSGGGDLALYSSSGVAASTFAVEFDTYSNPWDPKYRHIGINLYSRISYNLTKFDSATEEYVTARITYDATTTTITVVATTSTQSATLTYVTNLSDILSQEVQVGISSSTGSPTDYIGVHDIHSWSFTSNIATVSTINYDNKEAYTRKYVSM